jgi:hypothetical protein
MSLEAIGKTMDKQLKEAKEGADEVEKEFKGRSKGFKYICYLVLALLVISLGTCTIKSCQNSKPGVVVQSEPVPAPVPVAQPPVMVANPDPMAGVITGMAIGTIMSNGMRYDGHNGYYHSGYHGPPRTIVVNKVVNRTIIKTAAPAPVKPVVAAPAPAPVKTAVARPAPSTPARSSFFSSSPSRSSFSSSPSRSSYSYSSPSRSSFSSGGRR